MGKSRATYTVNYGITTNPLYQAADQQKVEEFELNEKIKGSDD